MCLDFLGKQLDFSFSKNSGLLGDGFGRHRSSVNLDNVGYRQKRVLRFVKTEVVQSNPISCFREIRQSFEQDLIDRSTRVDLQHNPVFGQRGTVVTQQEIRSDIYKRGLRSDNLIQSDIDECFEKKPCRRSI